VNYMPVRCCRLAANTWHLTSCAASCRLLNTPDNRLQFQTVFSRQTCYQVSVDNWTSAGSFIQLY